MIIVLTGERQASFGIVFVLRVRAKQHPSHHTINCWNFVAYRLQWLMVLY
jgi:hypothetical protein